MQGVIVAVTAVVIQCPFLRWRQGVLGGRFRLYRLTQDFIDALYRFELVGADQVLVRVIRSPEN
ncbi:hypothetical protein D3C81_2159520 [compost metagenome]